MKMKLSNTKVKSLSLEAGKKQIFVWDESLPSFGVYVGQNVKTYVIQFTTKVGAEKRHKIGRVDVLSYDSARQDAIRILGEIQRGADPTAAVKKARRESQLSEELLRWFDEHSLRPTTRKTWRSVINNHIIPTLGSLKPSAITKHDIAAAYKAIQVTSGRQANQAITILSSFYNRLADGGENPASAFRNDKIIRKHRDGEREVVLTQDEVRRLLAYCERSPAQQSADALRLLIWTGARIGEILPLRWEDVNLAQGTVFLNHTATKEAKAKTLHLSPRALSILERRRGEAAPDAEYVFPGKKGTGFQQVLKAFWASACKHCGIVGVHVHDLRATYSTHLIASGESAKAVGKTMGHADTKTTLRYERIAQDRTRQIASKIDGLF
jgi:integrase